MNGESDPVRSDGRARACTVRSRLSLILLAAALLRLLLLADILASSPDFLVQDAVEVRAGSAIPGGRT